MSRQIKGALLFLVIVVAVSAIAGCTITLVAPYDEKLVTDTEALFKKASTMIDDGIAKSPRTDAERAAITTPEAHPAHMSQFDGRYNSLGTDADALILRAVARSRDVGPVGEKLQSKINALIEEALPSQCEDIESELGVSAPSLTVKNFLDLKCLLVRWKAQHADPKLTQDTRILKRSNWELRKSAIFSAALAIERAETSKKP
jgi:hypothetical protein